jgi:hypothetical protein
VVAGIVEPVAAVPVWATVELDRAAASIAVASRSTPILDAPALGARARIVGLVDGAEPPEIVVAEPATEGGLAAFLARHGEGWAAVYLRGDASGVERLRASQVALAVAGQGPYGPERLILGGERSGPFLVFAGG